MPGDDEENAALFADQVPDVPVIFRANELEDFFVREVGDAFLRPRFCQHARVVDSDLDFEMAEIGAPVALDDVQLIRVRMSFYVEPDSGSKPTRSTTSVSPSQWPMECPYQAGFGSPRWPRPSR